MTKPYEKIKRILDAVGAVVLLVVLSPVLGVVALMVRLHMGAPVLFRQQRPGKEGRAFTLYKFRTMMCDDAGQSPDQRSLDKRIAGDAHRLTPLGRTLRATSLDELPELYNIVKGDMSFVGPRPLLVEYLPLYNAQQARRHEVRPGLTGLAQVSGRNALSWPQRFELDVEYVDRCSFALDMRILARTVGEVFARRGISSETSATVEPFSGER